MSDYERKWRALDDTEEAFGQIVALEFLAERLQESVDKRNHLGIVDAATAITAFLPVYQSNFDDKFRELFGIIITEEDLKQ